MHKPPGERTAQMGAAQGGHGPREDGSGMGAGLAASYGQRKTTERTEEAKVIDYDVTLTFIEPLLGTVPKSKEIYMKWVIQQAKERGLTDEQIAEELETIEDIAEKGWTGFHMLDGSPVLYDYVIKGFFKDACGMLRRVSDTRSSKLTAYRKVIDGLVFIFPRRIRLDLNGGDMGMLERPLRAQTAQGERIALTRSDICPEDTTASFRVNVLGQVKKSLLCEWFNYGQLRGLGQWRNASYGRFTYTMSEIS